MRATDSSLRMPGKGREASSILAEIRSRKDEDRQWSGGQMFGYVYSPDEGAISILRELTHMYMFENPLNATVFPSLAWFEREVVSNVANLLHGDRTIRGNVTSGGTESIFLALKAARNYARAKRPESTVFEVILPESVHPAFHKATDSLCLKEVILPLGADYRADIGKLGSLITPETILVVGSAPSYAHGTIDPIPEMAEIAANHGLLFHVDACLGGLFLPFMEMLGHELPVFDFRLPGVTSVSADVHKFGYGIKGASVLLHRNQEVWKRQFYVSCIWPAGLFGTPTLLGSRSAVPVVGAWAMMQYFGVKGYLELTRRTMEAVGRIRKGISETEGLDIAGDPPMSVFAITSRNDDIFRIGEVLEAKGWILDRIMRPEGLHLIFTYPNITMADRFLADLRAAAAQSGKGRLRTFAEGLTLKAARGFLSTFPKLASSVVASMASKGARKPGDPGKGSAVFYGISASIGDTEDMDALVTEFLQGVYAPEE